MMRYTVYMVVPVLPHEVKARLPLRPIYTEELPGVAARDSI